ncbi:MAG: D-glycerate dehydrogenase [Cyclobacteriaceae bacterium]|nr:D-glycerate dehydrogenase [Cyclobacteriaceae bacterium]HCZ36315.1 D-glycerate dehydrogenase [Cytophagales bacterium]HRG08836.1 D-glycerate dehydrogenase [Cyclobacteriaceae bacterium]
MSKKVLVTRIIPGIAEDMLKQAGFDVTVWQGDRAMTKDELIEHALQANILLSLGSNKLDRSFFETCKHLEIVSQFAVGFDNIDVAAATDYKIPVCNTPDVLSEATADVAFGLMINVSRKMFYNHKLILRGEWKQFEPLKNLGFELSGKTVGIFGLGRIGSIMAHRCKGAYGMNVIYHNRNRNIEAETETGARYVDFDTLLRESDILSVHSALTDETKGLFNKHVFSKMKRTAVFINTARGGVHNETDLIEALQNGTIWGAGLDVTNPEPMQANNPLLEMPNVAVLPHIGSATIEARTGMARLAAENIISYFQTGKPITIVNPEVLHYK